MFYFFIYVCEYIERNLTEKSEDLVRGGRGTDVLSGIRDHAAVVEFWEVTDFVSAFSVSGLFRVSLNLLVVIAN